MKPMTTVHLGTSSLQSSRVAYGCWRLAGTGDPQLVTPEKEAHGQAAVLAAFEHGYTLYDLADVYCAGVAETIFGKALKQAPAMRKQIVIATKCGIRVPGDPDPQAPYRYDFSAQYIVGSCERSLQRLGVETIDLYLLHRPDLLCEPTEVAEAFDRLKQSGKVREFGVSNFRPSQVTTLQRACPMKLIANQIEISLAHLDPFQDGALDLCLAERITPMAWSPLAGGRLGSGSGVDMQDPNHAHKQRLNAALEQVARGHGAPKAAIALAWLLKHPSNIIPIVGSTNPDRIREAANSPSISLSREEWYRLYEAALGQRLP